MDKEAAVSPPCTGVQCGSHLGEVLITPDDTLDLQQVLGDTHTRQTRKHSQVAGDTELCNRHDEMTASILRSVLNG